MLILNMIFVQRKLWNQIKPIDKPHLDSLIFVIAELFSPYETAQSKYQALNKQNLLLAKLNMLYQR